MNIFSFDCGLRYFFLTLFLVFVCLTICSSRCLGLQFELSDFQGKSSSANRGAEYLKKNQFDRAVSLGEKMVRDEPKDFQGYLLLTLAYMGKDDQQAVRTQVEEAMQIQPEFGVKIYYAIGKSYALQKCYYRALSYLERAAEIKKTPQVIKTIGEIYLVRGQIKKAKKYLEQLPDPSDSCLDLSRIYLLEKKYPSAAKFAQKAIAQKKGHIEGYVVLGSSYFKMDRLEPAKDVYLQILNINPRFYLSSYYLGLIYLIQGDYDRALDYFQSVTLVLPKAKEPLFGEAIAWHLKGYLTKAKDVAEKAVTSAPGDFLGYLVRGNIYVSKGEYNEADSAFKKTSGLFHDFALPSFKSSEYFAVRRELIPAYFSLANILLREGLYQSTIDIVDTALKISSRELPFLLFTKARALARIGRLDEAEKIYQLVIKRHPSIITPLREVGDLEAEKGNIGLAVQYYNRAALIDPRWTDIHFLLGRLYLKRGQTNKAIDEYKKVISISPRSAVGYNQLAWILGEKTKDYKTAISYALKGSQLNSKSVDIQDTLGWLYYNSGNFRAAEKVYARMDMTSIKNPTIFYHMGLLYKKVGKRKKALTVFEYALDLSDEFPEASEIKRMLEVMQYI